MASCLMAPSLYLNQLWLTINEFVLWNSFQGNIYLNTQGINAKVVPEMYTFEITVASPRGQWVNSQETLHISPLWANWGMSIVRYFGEIYLVSMKLCGTLLTTPTGSSLICEQFSWTFNWRSVDLLCLYFRYRQRTTNTSEQLGYAKQMMTSVGNIICIQERF